MVFSGIIEDLGLNSPSWELPGTRDAGDSAGLAVGSGHRVCISYL